MTKEQIAEVQRIHAAVDEFATAMKQRLSEKVEAGYTGWDDPEDVSDFDLETDIISDTHDGLSGNPERCCDTGNRVMFLWWRSK